MLTSMAIDNFRGFRHLDVATLPQVTLLVGRNGSGKTSLLEAALALYGRNAPSWILGLQAHRGLSRFSPTRGPQYTGLFYDFGDQGRATIEGATTDGHRWRVELEKAPFEPLSTFAPSTATTNGAAHQPDLICRASCDGVLQNESSVIWRVDKDGRASLKIDNPRAADPPALLLHPGTKEAVDEEEVERFGTSKAAGHARAIIDGLRVMYPSIEDVEFLRTRAGESFFAKVAGKYVPVGLLGGGVNNVLRYLISLDGARGGLLAIDEIENGIHYSSLPDVLRSLVDMALTTGTQLMMSTHSGHAVAALSRAAEERLPGYREQIGAIHVQRGANDDVVLTSFVGHELASSVELGYELR